MSDATIAPSRFQTSVLAVPEVYDLALLGGRGGGKTWSLALIVLRYVEKFGRAARVLLVRKTYAGLRDVEDVFRLVFGMAYGSAASFNQTEHLWRLPSGATVELNQLDTQGDLQKFQGRSFTMVVCEEAGQWPDPSLLDSLRANLRAAAGVPLRWVLAANPGGAGHSWIQARYAGATPWRPHRDERSGRTVVVCPSTYRDNPHIDQDEYRAQLEAATDHDAELRKAWLDGDWAIARGAFFAGVLSDRRSALDPDIWTPDAVRRLASELVVEAPTRDASEDPVVRAVNDAARRRAEREEARSSRPRLGGWAVEDSRPPIGVERAPTKVELFLAHDFGVSAPSVTYLVARSRGFTGPDEHFYPAGSLLLLDELATVRPGFPNQGLGWTVPRLAEEVVRMCAAWGCQPWGCADDAIFSKQRGQDADSIADEFLKAGVSFQRASKGDRISGWQVMRRLLADAGTVDRPGLYVSRRCSYFWQTVPSLPRSERHVEDVDTNAADHAADAVRYAVGWKPGRFEVAYIGGTY